MKNKHKSEPLIKDDEIESNIRETERLLVIPNMGDSIIEGMQQPITECEKELNW